MQNTFLFSTLNFTHFVYIFITSTQWHNCLRQVNFKLTKLYYCFFNYFNKHWNLFTFLVFLQFPCKFSAFFILYILFYLSIVINTLSLFTISFIVFYSFNSILIYLFLKHFWINLFNCLHYVYVTLNLKTTVSKVIIVWSMSMLVDNCSQHLNDVLLLQTNSIHLFFQ